jgi:arsenite-transporting ATPase
MRIIFFAGKGGVGKTSVAGATAMKSAQMGKDTLLMSLDIAHSLADIFDLDLRLMDQNKGEPVQVDDHLWIQELDVQEEIQKHWGGVYEYFIALLNTSGFDEVLAEELAIIPGMEEVTSLLYINSYAQEERYQTIILDCAPTGESLRFISIPTALEWYIKKVFNLERRLAKVVRPVARHLTDLPLPEDEYFADLEGLFQKLQGVDKLLSDPDITTVRLVTNPEKIVLKETQRAYMYFCLYRMCIDAVIVNRVFPSGLDEAYFTRWRNNQKRYIQHAEEYFKPVPIFKADLFPDEIVGKEAMKRLAEVIYGDRDPTQVFYREMPYGIIKKNGAYQLAIKLPFISKQDVEVHRVADELIVRIGAFKRHILLPKQVAASDSAEAHFEGDRLTIVLGRRKNAQEN